MTERRYPTSIEGVTAKAVYRKPQKPHPDGAIGDRPPHMKTWVRVLPSSIADIEKMMPAKQTTGIITSQPAQNKEDEGREGRVHLFLGRDDVSVVKPEEAFPADNSCCSKLCRWYIGTCCASPVTDDD